MFKDELLRGNEYLEYTKEILARGKELSVSQGKFVGSRTPFGFDKEKLPNEKGFKLVPNQDIALVKLIFEMALDGKGTHLIASHLRSIGTKTPTGKGWTHTSVRLILENPSYKGYLTWERHKQIVEYVNGEIKKVDKKLTTFKLYKGLHDPVISEEDFEKAGRLRSEFVIAAVGVVEARSGAVNENLAH